MKNSKRFSFFICRTDKAESIITALSLDEAKRFALALWRLAPESQKPVYNICTKEGAIIAIMRNGRLKLA